MNTITISIGRNIGYGTKELSKDDWNDFQGSLAQTIRQAGLEIICSTIGRVSYVADGQSVPTFEDTRQFVMPLPSDKPIGDLLNHLAGLASTYQQEEIAVTYGVFKPVKLAR